jgi:parallel beta-helix repeat protein
MTKLFHSLFLLCFFSIVLPAQSDFENNLLEQLINAEDGTTITLPAGNYSMNGSLWLDGKNDITIKGAGINQTTITFKDQTEGAEGIKITDCTNVILSDFTVQDSKGDLIKTQNVNGITFLNVKTEWTGKPDKNNGAYGLYPVQCQNVVIDGCVAIGASDAGIYVGQSDKIVVKNSKAINNVAGIEIENSTNADVFDNEAYGNTGGILVFDLPGLIKKKGGNVRIFNNNIHDNNYKNFAPKGNIVGMVPPGTGVMILATSDVQIYDNEIVNNRSFSLVIASYYITENKIKDEEYDPYPYRIYVRDNNFVSSKKKPTFKNKLAALVRLKYKKTTPSILYDGITDESHFDENGNRKSDYEICFKNNKNGTFGNLDAANNFENLNRDITPFECGK